MKRARARGRCRTTSRSRDNADGMPVSGDFPIRAQEFTLGEVRRATRTARLAFRGALSAPNRATVDQLSGDALEEIARPHEAFESHDDPLPLDLPRVALGVLFRRRERIGVDADGGSGHGDLAYTVDEDLCMHGVVLRSVRSIHYSSQFVTAGGARLLH